MFRPAAMVWTDLLVDRSAVNEALEIMGCREIIELRAPGSEDRSFPVVLEPDEETIGRLLELQRLLQPVADEIPPPGPAGERLKEYSHATADVLPLLEENLNTWLDAATPLIGRLRRCETDLEELSLLATCLESITDNGIDIGLLAGDGPARGYRGFVACSEAGDKPARSDLGEAVMIETYPLVSDDVRDGVVMVGACAADELATLEGLLHADHWRFVQIPAGVRGSGTDALKSCRKLMSDLHRRHQETTRALGNLNEQSDIAKLYEVLRRHVWVNEVLVDARLGERFVWLCGWVPQKKLNDLATVLDREGIPFLLNTETSDRHGPPPVSLDNSRWARRFETFVRGFGVPRSDEVDPTVILAATTPLMFGYMFGDVGHGAILFLAGLWLRERYPFLGLLVPAGVASMLFGLLFGSLFCNEHVIPALWVTPMQEPVMILALPVAFGMLLMLLSMALDAVQETWHGHALEWWLFKFPLVLSFIGLAATLFDARAVTAAAAGAIWLVAAHTIRAARESGPRAAWSAPFAMLAELAEALLQMVINTISFSRLGAFALAHSGLGMAVMILAAMPEATLLQWLILVAGNVLVIALEGLVVSIQTTRLVMFEFFRRFLRGHGRPFQPLRAPGEQEPASAGGAA